MSKQEFKRIDPLTDEEKSKFYSTSDRIYEVKTMTLEEIKSKYPDYIKDEDIIKRAKDL